MPSYINIISYKNHIISCLSIPSARCQHPLCWKYYIISYHAGQSQVPGASTLYAGKIMYLYRMNLIMHTFCSTTLAHHAFLFEALAAAHDAIAQQLRKLLLTTAHSYGRRPVPPFLYGSPRHDLYLEHNLPAQQRQSCKGCTLSPAPVSHRARQQSTLGSEHMGTQCHEYDCSGWRYCRTNG